MRIKLDFSKNVENVPINNQNIVNGFVQKHLGPNNPYHDAISDYSVSMLSGGKLNDDKATLSFKNGGFIIVSALDNKFIMTLLKGIAKSKDKSLGYGMVFEKYEFIDEKIFDGWNYFSTLSPFMIVKDGNALGRNKFLLLDDPDFESQVKDYLLHKLVTISVNKKLNLNLLDFDVKIPKHPAHKVKTIYIHGMKKGKVGVSKNYANVCRVNIKSSKQVAELLYNIGLGQSCGCGFGTIYKNENKDLYRFN
jgi:CRISPR-associated endoribonuclease Cas6